jgi:hypothetical protein
VVRNEHTIPATLSGTGDEVIITDDWYSEEAI